MYKSIKLALIFSLTFLINSVAHAIIIDFSGEASGDTGSSSLTIGDATFDVLEGGTVFVYRPGDYGNFDNGGICAYDNGNCETDWTLTFDTAVTNFSFDAEVYNPVDYVVVEAFNGATSLGTIDITAVGNYSFGSAVITSLFFDDQSTGAGFAFGDFSYEYAAVPEPSIIALLSLGLIGIGVARRRKI